MLDHLFKKCFNAPEDMSKAYGDELRHKINEAADISAMLLKTTLNFERQCIVINNLNLCYFTKVGSIHPVISDNVPIE